MNQTSFAVTGVEIRLDGQPLELLVARKIAEVVVRQTLDAPALAEVTIAQPEIITLDSLAAGTGLTIALNSGDLLFRGKIAGLDHLFAADGSRTLKVRAHDTLEALRLTRRFRAFESVSPADAWTEAAGQLGLTCDAVAGSVPCSVVQAGTSDLTFLVSIARAQGFHVILEGDTLRMVSLAGFGETIEAAWGGRLIAVHLEEAGEDAGRLGRAYGWDPATAETFEATAPTARQDEDIEISGYGLAGLREDEGWLLTANRPAGSMAAVATYAQDIMDRSAATQTIATGTLRGSGDVRPGVRLRLTGLGLPTPPTVVVVTATHIINVGQGYTTEFSSRPPAQLPAEAGPIVTLARVVDIEDSAGGARVKVSLPAFGGIKPGFLSVVVPGAGAAKGVAAFPDVGDDVIALFPTRDLAHGLVLGGIYGAQRLPRGSAAQHPRPLVLASGNNQRLVLGGTKANATLSTSNGDRLSLGGAPSQLVVAGNLEIAAVGGTITIKAQKVKFERI